MTTDFRHPRRARVRTGAEYERVFKSGKRAALPAAALHWRPLDVDETPADAEIVMRAADSVATCPTVSPLTGANVAMADLSLVQGPARLKAPSPTARLGLAVSRKVDPDAVGRNRIKRVWRDAFRQLRTRLPVADYVMVARPPCRQLDNDALRALLVMLLRRSGALPPQGTAVTLAPAAADPSLPSSAPIPFDSVPTPASAERPCP